MEIAIIESPASADTELTRDPITPEYDTLKAYMKGISSIPLLSNEGEVAIAMKIETYRTKIFSTIITIPFFLNKLVRLGGLVEKGMAPLSGIIQDADYLSEEEMEAKKKWFSAIMESISGILGKCEGPLQAGKDGILNKVQELKLKENVVKSFSEELKKMWGDAEHDISPDNRQNGSKIRKLESILGLGCLEIKRALKELDAA